MSEQVTELNIDAVMESYNQRISDLTRQLIMTNAQLIQVKKENEELLQVQKMMKEEKPPTQSISG